MSTVRDTPATSRRGFLGGAAALLLASGASGLLLPGTAGAATAGNHIAPRRFTHPGLLHTADDLARMRAAVAAQESPIHDGYLAFAAHARSKSTYPVQNTGQITSWGRGPTNFQNQAVADSAAAYQNALMWCVTGERAHADKARDILDAWSASLTMVTGADGSLGAGLQVFKFVNAAELLRHSDYDGWADADIARCERSFLDVWYPAISGYMLYANGNWDLTAIQSVLAIGVFCEEPVLFEDALRFAAAGAGNGSVPGRVVTDAGQGQESGRDQGHEQLAVGLMGDAAQVAWNQGVDLWGFDGNRILANAEYAARYNLGGDVPFTPDLDRTGKYLKTTVSDKVRGTLPPVYEMYYAHYAGVRGLDTPHTEAAVFRGTGGARFVEGGNDDLPGFGTFTYAGTKAPTPTAPTAPSGVTAIGAPDPDSHSAPAAVTVSWLPSAWATTYTVRRASRPEGPYEELAAGLDRPEYRDTDVRAGRTYYYTASATNSRGSSGDSSQVAATAGLPEPWSTQDIGQVKTPGSAAFDGERFVLTASGNADTYRGALLRLPGDGSITARIVFPLSSQYTKIGVTLRDSLAPDAAHASMLIQGLPLHTWSGVWTVRPRTGGAVSATGSTPVPPTQQRAITTSAAFPISDLGELPESATPLEAPYVEGAGDGYRLRAPYWVRVTRRGRRCTGAISPDGIRWTQVGASEVELGRTVYAGLVLTSCLGVDAEYAETGTGAFDNVTVTSTAHGEVWSVPRPTRTAAGLKAATGTDAVGLAWTDPDLSARYKVLRATAADGPFETIATGIGPVGFGTRLRYADATGAPGATYHYVVAKTNTGGRGPHSDPVSARMPTP
ncbi:MAG: Ig family protein, partial [Streptomyces sp.]|nr:Ig family protein [Streptomyces sp.]